jgi:putative transposase
MVMDLNPSGYYAWKKQPVSDKVRDDQRRLGLLKQAWLESGCVYGYRELTLDMRDLGECCGKHRVVRLLCSEGIRSQAGYRCRSCGRGGKPAWWPLTTLADSLHLRDQTSLGSRTSPASVPTRVGFIWP